MNEIMILSTSFVVVLVIMLSIQIPINLTMHAIRNTVTTYTEYKRKHDESKNAIPIAISRIEYSDKFIEFIVKFITDHVSMTFNEFIDGVNVKKVNKSILVKFISQNSTEIKSALKDDIDYDSMIYTQDYVNQLIIETTMYVVKGLWEKTLGEFIDNEELPIED